MADTTGIPIGEAQRRIESIPTAVLTLPSQGAAIIIDQGIIDAWPPDTKAIEGVSYAQSVGSTTSRVKVQMADGTVVTYFVKAGLPTSSFTTAPY